MLVTVRLGSLLLPGAMCPGTLVSHAESMQTGQPIDWGCIAGISSIAKSQSIRLSKRTPLSGQSGMVFQVAYWREEVSGHFGSIYTRHWFIGLPAKVRAACQS